MVIQEKLSIDSAVDLLCSKEGLYTRDEIRSILKSVVLNHREQTIESTTSRVMTRLTISRNMRNDRIAKRAEGLVSLINDQIANKKPFKHKK